MFDLKPSSGRDRAIRERGADIAFVRVLMRNAYGGRRCATYKIPAS